MAVVLDLRMYVIDTGTGGGASSALIDSSLLMVSPLKSDRGDSCIIAAAAAVVTATAAAAAADAIAAVLMLRTYKLTPLGSGSDRPQWPLLPFFNLQGILFLAPSHFKGGFTALT